MHHYPFPSSKHGILIAHDYIYIGLPIATHAKRILELRAAYRLVLVHITCMFAYVHTHARRTTEIRQRNTHTQSCWRAPPSSHTHSLSHTHTHTLSHTHTCRQIHPNAYTLSFSLLHKHTHLHKYTLTHTCTQTHAQTHTRISSD